MDIEKITGLANISIEEVNSIATIYSNGSPAPDNVQRWYRACMEAGKELPYDAVDFVPAIIAGLAQIGITITKADEIRGQMPVAIQTVNGMYAASTTQDEKNELFYRAINLIAAYIGFVGRSY